MPGMSSTVTAACLQLLRDGLDPVDVVMRAETVIEGRAGDAVAVADFDRVDFGASSARAICRAASMLY
jgi:hypothetical protein